MSVIYRKHDESLPPWGRIWTSAKWRAFLHSEDLTQNKARWTWSNFSDLNKAREFVKQHGGFICVIDASDTDNLIFVPFGRTCIAPPASGGWSSPFYVFYDAEAKR